MPLKVIVTRNFRHMSEVAAETVKKNIMQTLRKQKEFVLGLVRAKIAAPWCSNPPI